MGASVCQPDAQCYSVCTKDTDCNRAASCSKCRYSTDLNRLACQSAKVTTTRAAPTTTSCPPTIGPNKCAKKCAKRAEKKGIVSIPMFEVINGCSECVCKDE